jgi:hypothetical protein
MNMTESIPDVPAVLGKAKALAEGGSWDDAIRVLTEANLQQENERFEARLVKLRHMAYDEIGRPEPIEPWPRPVPDHFPGIASIPEIPFSEMTVELVASAIQYHGSILIRGMFDPEACEQVRLSIDETFERKIEVEGDKQFDPSPWYTHFVQRKDKGYQFGGMERYYADFSFGVLAVDSPRALFRYIEVLKAAGLDKFLHDYFGERPAFSAKKSTLRRTPHDASAGWHQDGAYYGLPQRSLNIWAAFSHCGVKSPSLDIFAKRFETLAETGGPGLADDAIGEETVAKFGGGNPVRPVFAPGDAILFDELALHRTGISSSMTETRYAIEMWFFAASMFPHQQVPLYL